MQETLVRFLGWEDFLEKVKATHSSILGCWKSGFQGSSSKDSGAELRSCTFNMCPPPQVGALTVHCSQVQGENPQSSYKHSSGQATFNIDPVRDLLIWAIVQNRRELAEIIWAQVSRLQLSVDQ